MTRENYELGARLKAARERQQMTQTKLAELVGITYQQIHKYESGKNTLTVTGLKRLAAGLGVDPCEICGCCDPMVRQANAEIIRQMKEQHEHDRRDAN